MIISFCEDIINISPNELKTVKFTPLKTYYIFKYNHIIYSNTNTSHYTVRAIQNKNIYDYKFYSYTNAKNITQKNGQFINSFKNDSLKTSLIFINNPSQEYYIVIQYKINYNYYYELEETFYFFSSDSLYEVKNTFFDHYYLVEKANYQNYIFSIYTNHMKYVKFGLIKKGSVGKSSLTIMNDNSNHINNTIYRIDKDYFEDIIELEENHTYYFNFSLTYTINNNLFFLYLLKMNYSNIITVEKNKEEFEYFPVSKGINILLNTTSTPKKHKLYFEYSSNWYEKTICSLWLYHR